MVNTAFRALQSSRVRRPRRKYARLIGLRNVMLDDQDIADIGRCGRKPDRVGRSVRPQIMESSPCAEADENDHQRKDDQRKRRFIHQEMPQGLTRHPASTADDRGLSHVKSAMFRITPTRRSIIAKLMCRLRNAIVIVSAGIDDCDHAAKYAEKVGSNGLAYQIGGSDTFDHQLENCENVPGRKTVRAQDMSQREGKNRERACCHKAQPTCWQNPPEICPIGR